jgi:hypothetical protein
MKQPVEGWMMATAKQERNTNNRTKRRTRRSYLSRFAAWRYRAKPFSKPVNSQWCAWVNVPVDPPCRAYALAAAIFSEQTSNKRGGYEMK